jgi:hypothetical protein
MKQPVTMAVLSVSPHYGDHDALEEIFRSSEGEWKLYKSLSLQPATVLLRLHKIPIVVCECDLQPGSWRELQERTFSMPGRSPGNRHVPARRRAHVVRGFKPGRVGCAG